MRWKSFLKKKKAMIQISLEEAIAGIKVFAAPLFDVDSGARSKWNPEIKMREK